MEVHESGWTEENVDKMEECLSKLDHKQINAHEGSVGLLPQSLLIFRFHFAHFHQLETNLHEVLLLMECIDALHD